MIREFLSTNYNNLDELISRILTDMSVKSLPLFTLLSIWGLTGARATGATEKRQVEIAVDCKRFDFAKQNCF